MPELPEVETVVRGLRLSLPGRAVAEVRFGKTDFVDNPGEIGQNGFPGMRIANVARMGKFICVGLAQDSVKTPVAPNNEIAATPLPFYLIIHLGMTGRLTVVRSGESAAPHTHVVFRMEDGGELHYTDIRRFGRMLVIPGSKLAEFKGKLGGKEPLEIGADEFCRDFASRHARLKALLLDQSVLCGVGNIYADESLFRAKLHPARIAEKLNQF